METTIQGFQEELESGCRRVRGAFAELLSEIGADSDTPTALALRLGINKTLAWRVAKLVAAGERSAVLEHLPRSEGLEILLSACRRLSASPGTLKAAKEAVAALERIVETHAGDRETLDMMLASNGEGGPQSALEGRRLAYLGNSSIFGVQARTRFALAVEAPSAADASRIDFALLGGLIGLRRLRTDTSVPLFIQHSYHDDGSPLNNAGTPLDTATAHGSGMPLVGEFCTAEASELAAFRAHTMTRYELKSGPVGNTAAMNWVFGWIDRGFGSIYRDERNEFGESSVRNSVPAERMVCDLLVHRDLPLPPPQAFLYGQLGAGLGYPYAGRERDLLPIAERVESLGRFPPTIGTPAVPRYGEMLRRVMTVGGWRVEEFVGYRLEMQYPPVPTVAVLRTRLPRRP